MRGHTSALTLSLLLFSATAAGAQDWCKSKWGPDDEKGAANHLTAARAGGGQTDQDRKGLPARRGDQLQDAGLPASDLQPHHPSARQTGGNSLGPTKTTYNDDIITGWVGTGSQLDGLGHIGVDNVYYNCNKAAISRPPTG